MSFSEAEDTVYTADLRVIGSNLDDNSTQSHSWHARLLYLSAIQENKSEMGGQRPGVREKGKKGGVSIERSYVRSGLALHYYATSWDSSFSDRET